MSSEFKFEFKLMPLCQHRDGYGRACLDYAIAECTTCDIKTCEHHLREWDRHEFGDPPFTDRGRLVR